MNATATATRPVLLGDRLHCPKCANELDIWEKTRQLDRIGYTAPRWDTDTEEWTYTSDDNPRNESVELLDRYAQCPARACGYLAPVEDRYDHDLPDAGDYWTCPGCADTVEPSDVRRHASECAHVDGAGQPT